jgi:hypothetical protein
MALPTRGRTAIPATAIAAMISPISASLAPSSCTKTAMHANMKKAIDWRRFAHQATTKRVLNSLETAARE